MVCVTSFMLLLTLVMCNYCRLLNQQSDEDSGRNTALHIAAGNVNVTREFIRQLKSANAKIQNSAGDTPFHVAAKSSNPNAIIHMLNTFSPSKGGWDVDDADDNRDEKAPTLLNICAVNGNAEAVALLIQHGADLAKGVLQEIVIESVCHIRILGGTQKRSHCMTTTLFCPTDIMI